MTAQENHLCQNPIDRTHRIQTATQNKKSSGSKTITAEILTFQSVSCMESCVKKKRILVILVRFTVYSFGLVFVKMSNQQRKNRHLGKYDTPKQLGIKWQLDVKYVPNACYSGNDGENFISIQ